MYKGRLENASYPHPPLQSSAPSPSFATLPLYLLSNDEWRCKRKSILKVWMCVHGTACIHICMLYERKKKRRVNDLKSGNNPKPARRRRKNKTKQKTREKFHLCSKDRRTDIKFHNLLCAASHLADYFDNRDCPVLVGSFPKASL